jgi:non-specific serine/threonine protein kinase/serine/threonine-protein kinase
LRLVRALFDAAMEKAPGERRALVDREAGSDSALRDEVLSLLADEEAAKGFLSGPVALPESLAAGEPAPPAPSLVGRQIGAYRLLDEIGHGGMGTVYRAARTDDAYQKIVALKLVRGGAASDFIRQRFQRERQILGRLQHPHIAAIFDGGTTEEGHPYLVMEYVEGEPIDRHCAARQCATRERLEMFRQVCAAVHYAHQNLVVHRDLKPGNILVTLDGTPKLLDFGIAKLLAAGLEPEDAPTATMLPMMTPEYASPEQVRGEAVTTASDVYSLGVVLYELLTGRRPYAVRTESLEEIVRAVCRTEPLPPSTAVRAASVTATRPAVTASELRGDLDTIVLKALRKEPARRYLSAQELSEDIRRHLMGLPVMARADSTAYRIGKFVARHRVGVAAGGLLALSLIGGIVMTVREARVAEVQRARAEHRFAEVRKLANTFMFDIHDQIRDLPGSTKARESLVATAREYLDSLAYEAQGDPGLQRELAGAYERLADVQGGSFAGNVGDTKSALESYRKAVAIREGIALKDRKEPDDSKALSVVQVRLGELFRTMNRLPDAEASYRGVIERLETLAASRAPGDVRGALADAYAKIAEVQVQLGRGDAAGRSLQKAIDHGEAFSRDHPADAHAQMTLATSYYVDAESLRARGQYHEALARAHQARTVQEALLQKDPVNQQLVRGLLFSLNREALNLKLVGQRRDAILVYRHAVEIAEDMLRRDPRDRWAQLAVIVAYASLGRTLAFGGEPGVDIPGEVRGAIPGAAGDALPWLRKAREIAARVVAEDPGMGFARNELAVIDSSIGQTLLAEGTAAARREGCQASSRALETWRRMATDGPLTADSLDDVHEVEARMAECRSPR